MTNPAGIPQVSKSFKSRIDSSPLLQLRVELHISCLPELILDVTGIGTVDILSQIAYLRRLRRNWLTAYPHSRLTINDFSISSQTTHHCGLSRWDSPNDHQPLGHTLSQPLVLLGRTIAMPCMVPQPSPRTDRMGFDALKFMRLPLFGNDSKKFNDLEQELFSHHPTSFLESGLLASSMFINYFDGWMAITDAEEWVVVLWSSFHSILMFYFVLRNVVSLHLRTFPGNAPYPGAERPLMEWKVQKEWSFTVIDTAGDHIAVAASSATTENPIVTSPFIVWNWKTGTPLVGESPYHAGWSLRTIFRQMEGEADGYLFLNKDTLLLLKFDSSCSKYYLDIVKIHSQTPNDTRFYLPSPREGRRYTHMHFMDRAETIDKDHRVQFIGIAALTQTTLPDGTTVTNDIMFFISALRLLDLYHTLTVSSREKRRKLLWHEWVNNRGRWIVSPAISRDGPTVCGTRGILSIRWPKAEFGFTKNVIDTVRLHIKSNIDLPCSRFVQYRDRSPVPWNDKYLMVLDFNPFILKEPYDGKGGMNIDTHIVHASEDPTLSVAQDLFSSEDIGEPFSQIPYRVTMSREPLGGSHIVPWEGGLVHWVSCQYALRSCMNSHPVISQRAEKQSFEVWKF